MITRIPSLSYTHTLYLNCQSLCVYEGTTCVKIISVTSHSSKQKVDEVGARCCTKRGPPAKTCLPNPTEDQTNHQHISTRVPTPTLLPPHAAALIKKRSPFPFVSLVTFELYNIPLFLRPLASPCALCYTDGDRECSGCVHSNISFKTDTSGRDCRCKAQNSSPLLLVAYVL